MRARRHVVGSVIAFALFAIVLVGAVVVIVAGGGHRSYRVPSGAMEPTLKLHTRLLADTDAYKKHEPRVGDIVVFHPPLGADGDNLEQCGVARLDDEICRQATRGVSRQSFIKRVVAVGPASVAIADGGQTVLDGRTVAEPFIRRCGSEAPADICDMPRPITVPKGMVFLLGDNRGNSDDARFWGPIPASQIIGRAERCGFLRLSCRPVR